MAYFVSDLCTGVIDSVVHSVERTMGYDKEVNYWFADTFSCKVERSLANASFLASNMILAATSVDRALVVAKPILGFSKGNSFTQRINMPVI